MSIYCAIKKIENEYECYLIISDKSQKSHNLRSFVSRVINNSKNQENSKMKSYVKINSETASDSISIESKSHELDEGISILNLNLAFLCLKMKNTFYDKFFKTLLSVDTVVLDFESICAKPESKIKNNEPFLAILEHFSTTGVRLELLNVDKENIIVNVLHMTVDDIKGIPTIKKSEIREITFQNKYSIGLFEDHLMLQSKFFDAIDNTSTDPGRELLKNILYSNSAAEKNIKKILKEVLVFLELDHFSVCEAYNSLCLFFRVISENDFAKISSLLKKYHNMTFLSFDDTNYDLKSSFKPFSEGSMQSSVFNEVNKKSIYSKMSLEENSISKYKSNITRAVKILNNIETVNCIIQVMSKYNCFVFDKNIKHIGEEFTSDNLSFMQNLMNLNDSHLTENNKFNEKIVASNCLASINFSINKSTNSIDSHKAELVVNIEAQKHNDKIKQHQNVESNNHEKQFIHGNPKFLDNLCSIKEKAKSLGIRTDFKQENEPGDACNLDHSYCYVVSDLYDQYLDLSRSMYRSRIAQIKCEVSKVLDEKANEYDHLQRHSTNEFEYCFKIKKKALSYFLAYGKNYDSNEEEMTHGLYYGIKNESSLVRHGTLDKLQFNKDRQTISNLNEKAYIDEDKSENSNKLNLKLNDCSDSGKNRMGKRSMELRSYIGYSKQKKKSFNKSINLNNSLSLQKELSKEPENYLKIEYFRKIEAMGGLYIFKETENYYLLMNSKICEINNTLKEIKNQIYEIEGRICKAYLENINMYKNTLLGLQQLVSLLDYFNNIKVFQKVQGDYYPRSIIDCTTEPKDSIEKYNSHINDIDITGCSNLLLTAKTQVGFSLNYRFSQHTVYLITGENMAGKTSYVRNLCHLTLLTKLGYRKNSIGSNLPHFDQIFYISSVEDLNYFFDIFNTSHLTLTDRMTNLYKNYSNLDNHENFAQIPDKDYSNSDYFLENNTNKEGLKFLKDPELTNRIQMDDTMPKADSSYYINNKALSMNLMEKCLKKEKSLTAPDRLKITEIRSLNSSFSDIKTDQNKEILASPLRLVIVDEIKCSTYLQIKFIRFAQKANIMTLFVTHSREIIDFCKETNIKIFSIETFNLVEGPTAKSNAISLAKKFIPEIF